MTVVQFDSHPRKSPDTWVAPQLAVIVPSYNERDNVPLLYEKVTAALGATPFEFIVVDDNSPMAPPKWCARWRAATRTCAAFTGLAVAA